MRQMPPVPQRWFRLILTAGCIAFTLQVFGADIPPVSLGFFIGGENDGVHDTQVRAAADGGFYFIAGGGRPLIKFSRDFAVQWELPRVRGSNDIEAVTELVTLAQGDSIALLSSSSPPTEPRLFGTPVGRGRQYLARLTPAGAKVWLRETTNVFITALAPAPQGGFVIAGFGSGAARIGGDEINLGSESYFLARFNDLLLNCVTGASAPVSANYISAVHPDAFGNCLVIGRVSGTSWSLGGTNVVGPGVFAACINSSGAAQWARRVSTNSFFMTSAADSSSLLVAWRSNLGAIFLSEMDLDGNPLRQTPLQGQAYAMLPGNPLLVAGRQDQSENWFLSAFDSQRNVLWRRAELGRSTSRARSIVPLSGGRIVVSGDMTPAGIFFDDIFLRDFSLLTISGMAGFVIGLDLNAPSFRVQPTDQNLITGNDATLRAEVFSPTPVTLQWLKNGQPISGQFDPTLRFSAISANDVGSYSAVASNQDGSVTSKVARVTVNSVEVTTLMSGLSSPRSPVLLPDGRILFVEAADSHVRVLEGGTLTNYAIATTAPTDIAYQNSSTVGGMLGIAEGSLNGVHLSYLSTGTLDPVSGTSLLLKPNAIATTEGLEYFVVAETNGHRIWKYEYGDLNILLEDAAISGIGGIAMDQRANVYIADRLAHTIRKRGLDGEFVTLAGTDQSGFQDGSGLEARFNGPTAIAADADGNLFVTDTGNSAIRRISPYGEVTTLSSAGQFNSPDGIAIASSDSLIITDTGGGSIKLLKFVQAASVDTRLSISFSGDLAITVSGPSTLYQIESSPRIGLNADWNFETFAQKDIPQTIALPGQTRFYRAAPAN